MSLICRFDGLESSFVPFLGTLAQRLPPGSTLWADPELRICRPLVAQDDRQRIISIRHSSSGGAV